MVDIDIILAGPLKNTVDRKYIKSFPSKFFKINEIREINLEPGGGFEDPYCSNKKFESLPKYNKLTILICNYYLEGNVITVKINDNLVVLSTYNFEELVKLKNLKFEKFILRFVLAYSIIYKINHNKLPTSVDFIHPDIQGCLFDYGRKVTDLLVFHDNPIISDFSKSKISNRELPQNFFQNLNSEIKKLAKSPIEKLEDYGKQNPVIIGLVFLVIGYLLSKL